MPMIDKSKSNISTTGSTGKIQEQKLRSRKFLAQILIKTAKDMTSKDQQVRLGAMRWSQTDLCKVACRNAGISYEHYLDVMRYLLHAGDARAPVAFRQLREKLLKVMS